jgi:hypothetical protein
LRLAEPAGVQRYHRPLPDEPTYALDRWLGDLPRPADMQVRVETRGPAPDPYRGMVSGQDATVIIDWAKGRTAKRILAAWILVAASAWSISLIYDPGSVAMAIGAMVLATWGAANVLTSATQIRLSRYEARVLRRGFPSSTQRRIDASTVKHIHIRRNDPAHKDAMTTYTVMAYPHKPWHPDDDSGQTLIVVPEREQAHLIARAWQMLTGNTATEGPTWEALPPAEGG